jgi:hypothetical protein
MPRNPCMMTGHFCLCRSALEGGGCLFQTLLKHRFHIYVIYVDVIYIYIYTYYTLILKEWISIDLDKFFQPCSHLGPDKTFRFVIIRNLPAWTKWMFGSPVLNSDSEQLCRHCQRTFVYNLLVAFGQNIYIHNIVHMDSRGEAWIVYSWEEVMGKTEHKDPLEGGENEVLNVYKYDI